MELGDQVIEGLSGFWEGDWNVQLGACPWDLRWSLLCFSFLVSDSADRTRCAGKKAGGGGKLVAIAYVSVASPLALA